MTTVTVDTATGEVTGNHDDLRLFDLPALDGHRADTLKLAFAGGIEIDLKDDDTIAWFNGLRFGQELDLHVTGVVGKTGWTIKTNSEGTETVVHTLGIQVHSYQPDSE